MSNNRQGKLALTEDYDPAVGLLQPFEIGFVVSAVVVGKNFDS